MHARASKVSLLCGGTAFAVFTASPALAQQGIGRVGQTAPTTTANDQGATQDIIITADKTARTKQKTPIAVSVVTGHEITREGRTRIDDVLANQPAVVVQGAARGFLVSIRGLGLNLPPQMGQGAVSTNYDGAFNSRAENASAGFYDLDRVEVLRGPQSTLYGRNSVGGVVNIISRDPTLSGVNGYVSGELGSYNLYHGEGAVNVPLSSFAALRVAGTAIHRDGFLSNGHDDNKAYAGRAKLLLQPSSNVRLVLAAEHVALRGQGPGGVPIASVLAGNRTTTDVSFGFQRVNYSKYWATLNADVGPGTLYVQPSLQRQDGRVLGAFGGNFSNAFDPKLTRQKALEVRYSALAGAPVQWNLGYYHYDNHNIQQTISGSCEDIAGNYVVPPAGYNAAPPGPPGPAPAGGCLATPVPVPYVPEIRNSYSDGIFGQTTVPLAPRFRIIAGARYSWEKISGQNIADTTLTTLTPVKDEHFDYRAGFEADVGEHSLLYGTVASGYRQGGYAFGGAPYDPEKMRSYEIGIKNTFQGGRILLNADTFYYDYKSFQLVVVDFTSVPPQILVPTMPGHEFGVELETAISPWEGGRFNGSVTYIDSKLEGLNGAYVGVPFPNSPKWQFKAGYAHDFRIGAGKLTPRVDFRALSRQLVFPEQTAVDDTSPSVQKAYATGDAFLTFEPGGRNLSFTAYVKNVNDKIIKQSHFFGWAQLAPPRTYGLTGTYRF